MSCFFKIACFLENILNQICESPLSSNNSVKKHMEKCVGLQLGAASSSPSANKEALKFQLRLEDTAHISESNHCNPSKSGIVLVEFSIDAKVT